MVYKKWLITYLHTNGSGSHTIEIESHTAKEFNDYLQAIMLPGFTIIKIENVEKKVYKRGLKDVKKD